MRSISRCLRNVVGDHCAAMQHGDPVRETEHHLHVMFHQQHGQVTIRQQGGERIDGLRRFLHRQALRRLIQQQQARLLRQAHRNFQQALVAMRQQSGRTVRDIGQAEPFQCCIAAPIGRGEDGFATIGLPAPCSAGLRGKAGIFPCCHLREQRGELESARDAALADRVR
jgi:hypothetical protein